MDNDGTPALLLIPAPLQDIRSDLLLVPKAKTLGGSTKEIFKDVTGQVLEHLRNSIIRRLYRMKTSFNPIFLKGTEERMMFQHSVSISSGTRREISIRSAEILRKEF